MSANETVVVSGRVPVNMRNRVEKKLGREGITPSELIFRIYSRIDSSDDLSWIDAESETSDFNPMDGFFEMLETIPMNTRLSAMTIDDYKKAIADRD